MTRTLDTMATSLGERFVPADRRSERIVRCLFGLLLFGVGVTLLIESDLGAAPWDVFHTGITELTGISTGWIIIITGVLLLLLWIPLREQPGLGTILNATVIGLVVGLTAPLVDDVELLVARIPMMLGGVVLIAIGSGFYIGAGLGPGPRDGLMTGLARRGAFGRSISIRACQDLRRAARSRGRGGARRRDRDRDRGVRVRDRPARAGVPPPAHPAGPGATAPHDRDDVARTGSTPNGSTSG